MKMLKNSEWPHKNKRLPGKVTFSTGTLSPLLFIVLLIVKLCGANISWWTVFLVPVGIFLGQLLVLILVFVFVMRMYHSIENIYDIEYKKRNENM